MKVTWEVKDIRAGRRYGKEATAETWLIGYMSSATDIGVTDTRWVSVSEVDGTVSLSKTKADLAEILTLHNYLPLELLK